jgi:hypothetical protein
LRLSTGKAFLLNLKGYIYIFVVTKFDKWTIDIVGSRPLPEITMAGVKPEVLYLSNQKIFIQNSKGYTYIFGVFQLV